jgi:GNAT superfamily N-acetyltransferase
MQMLILDTPTEIAKSFDAFVELRPNLINVQKFIEQVITQQKEGYKIISLVQDDEVRACIGFRILTMLAWGKILYVDDLITKKKYRNQGYGKFLLDYVTAIASHNECDQIHLDTGYNRHAAHKTYLNHGFEFNSHHLALNLNRK